MRLFTAIELPPDVRRTIYGWTHRGDGSDVKWVEEENLHVTLKFFGEVSEERVNELCASLKQIAPAGAPLLWPGPTNCFPNRGAVATIVMDVQGQVDRLERLYADVDSKARELGYRADRRPYCPHITLGRARPVLSPYSRAALSGKTMKTQHQFIATEFVLMQSLLKPQGPQYIPLARFPL